MKLAKDSLWVLTARIGTQGMAVLFTILLARRLGSAGFGEYAVIATVVFIGNMLTTFGTDMSLIREIAANGSLQPPSSAAGTPPGAETAAIPSALTIQLTLSLLFIAATWFIAPLVLKENPNALRIYIFALIPLSFFTVFTSVLRGRQFADAYTWLNLAGSVLQFILVWKFIRPGAGIGTLAFLLLLSQFGTALIGALICHWKVDGFWRNWRLDLEDVFNLLKVSSPLAVLTVIAMFQQRSSVLILSVIGGPAVTGIFSAAQKTIEAAKTGHGAVFTAIYPEMARSNGSNDFSRYPFERLKSLLRILILGAVIGAITLSALAMPITGILFGVGYEASVPALQILAWVLIPYTVNTFLTLKFVAIKKEKPVLRASLLSLIVLISLSLLWIPQMGAAGAGVSVLIAELTQAVILFLQWRRHGISKLSR